jgi:hypothetical protein
MEPIAPPLHALVEGLEIGRVSPKVCKVAVFPNIDEIIGLLRGIDGHGGGRSSHEHHAP